jgi:hypothetical protein
VTDITAVRGIDLAALLLKLNVQFRYCLRQGFIMKMRHISALVGAGAASIAIALAPAAAAAPTGLTCTYVGAQTTQCQSPGNVQINSDQQVTYPQEFPYYGNVLLFHHGGHHR